MDEQCPRVGDGNLDSSVYRLYVHEHVPLVDPTKYGLLQLPKIDPGAYFITSGDAVEKTRILQRDLWQLAGNIRRHSLKTKEKSKLRALESLAWQAAGASRKLLNLLVAIKGKNVFLETEWNNHILYVIQKNPRK